MAFAYRRSETLRTVPGATVRLIAVTTGVDIGRRPARLRLVHAAPRRVEVERDDGRVDVVRTRDLDRLARVAIVVIGAATTRCLRRRRSNR